MIIKQKIYPDIFKLARILPLSKSNTDRQDITNYRPLNNLCCLEKFTEQYFINEIEIFIKQNNILNDDIHGGRKRHSTKTAITSILNTLHYNYEKDAISAVLVSDLSASYDMVDSQICLQK